MRIKLLICFFIITAMSCSEKRYMGAKRPALEKPKCDKQLYLCLGGLGKGDFRAYARDNSIKSIKLIGRKFIDPEKDGKFNKGKFIQQLTKLFPHVSEEGIVMLDWEGQHYKAIDRNPANSPKFKQSERALLEVLRTAKKSRPNVKFGFYCIPGRKYWKTNQEWENKYADFINIANASDILFPSLYNLYETSQTSAKQQKKYAESNVRRALRLGKETNKLVFPVIWHRYAEGNKTSGLKLVPWEEMQEHIRTILATDYQGKRAESLVWWGADRYYFKRKNKNVMKEVSKEETFEEYFSRFYFSYLHRINQLVVESCK